MKLYLDYKKLFNNILFIVLMLGFYFFPPLRWIAGEAFSFAQTASEIQNKINQKDSDIQKLEQEIVTYQSELDSLGKQKNSLAKSLKELDLMRKKLNADIGVTQNKIDKTNLKIQNLSSDINTKENSIENNLDSIRLQIKNINELEENSLIENILSLNDFTDIWNDIDSMMTVRERIRIDVIKLKQIKGVLEDTKKITIDTKNELTKLRSQLSDQQKIVVQNTNEKNKLLKQTKNNEVNYQKLLKDRITKRDAFEKELRDYEAQLQFILDPSKLPSGRVLSWPLEKVYVTQLFGKTVDSKRLYASGTHNGVDFRASIGTPVLAMADGKVLGIGDTDLVCFGASFGKFVFIEFNNGLSNTFGHLSLIKTYEGEQVKRGDIIGYSGNTGHSTGPHLHVSLYASQAVKMASKTSIACGGRIYRLPVSPINAYLNVLSYLPAL
ncbi:MAG: peptidoglycan DD-metalloendopeptidase family protein [Candidatus Paceibacterota bacterium]